MFAQILPLPAQRCSRPTGGGPLIRRPTDCARTTATSRRPPEGRPSVFPRPFLHCVTSRCQEDRPISPQDTPHPIHRPAPAPSARTRPAAAARRRPPFALLRRRTPGRDHDTVELLIGPVHEAATASPTSPDDGPVRWRSSPSGRSASAASTSATTARRWPCCVPSETYELPLDEVLARAARASTCGSRTGASTWATRSTRRSWAASSRTRSGRARARTSSSGAPSRGEIPGFGRGRRARAVPAAAGAASGARTGRSSCTPGERTLVGASPEVHVRMTGGTVVMNPDQRHVPLSARGARPPRRLLDFLADRKEIEELSMVVDEELKMMCTVGDMGGVVVGPRLKEMAHLAHTEYELRGRSPRSTCARCCGRRCSRRRSPARPCRTPAGSSSGTSDGGRGYYAGALALIGRDAGGAQTLDSPILIRTADIDAATDGCGCRSAPRWCAAPTRRARSPRRTRRPPGC